METHEDHLRMAVALARQNADRGGRPFGAVIVKDGAVIATGINNAVASKDPTSHAELEAIRAASQKLGTDRLEGCIVYASGHPCPMCLAAMYLAGITEGYFAHTIEDGAPYGLSPGEKVFQELRKPIADQSLHLRHHAVPSDDETLYAFWARKNKPGD